MVKRAPEPPGDIPAWVMTFSDVITLLMTFFILLLTFATNEPEAFDAMHEGMFDGSGASGIAGESTSANPKDAILFRQRSSTGRSTSRGSEMPPVNTEPTRTALNRGIAGLREEERRELSTTHTIRLPWDQLIGKDGAITVIGRQRLRMLAFQVTRQNLTMNLLVRSSSQFDATATIYKHLMADLKIPAPDIGVGENKSVDEQHLRIDITKRFSSTKHGS